uniref:Uncharacterized protein n=1 Tax=Strigamia maritima TaxID=126957 RepID=T1JBE8_STRMM
MDLWYGMMLWLDEMSEILVLEMSVLSIHESWTKKSGKEIVMLPDSTQEKSRKKKSKKSSEKDQVSNYLQHYPEADQTEALDLFPESEDVEMLLADVPSTATCAQETEASSGQDVASNLTKMQMEILELELRARAIKALLRSQSQRTSNEDP